MYMKIMIAFVIDGPDGIGRRVYVFHCHKVHGQVLDVKKLIQNDFGYAIEQMKIFRNYKEIPDERIFSKIPEFDNDEEILLFVPNG